MVPEGSDDGGGLKKGGGERKDQGFMVWLVTPFFTVITMPGFDSAR